jgi:hypothetical protein
MKEGGCLAFFVLFDHSGDETLGRSFKASPHHCNVSMQSCNLPLLNVIFQFETCVKTSSAFGLEKT